MMKDSILKMEAYATHVKLMGPDAMKPVIEKPLTLTERSGLECAQGYVRALMNTKLTRVRDIFREMDAGKLYKTKKSEGERASRNESKKKPL